MSAQNLEACELCRMEGGKWSRGEWIPCRACLGEGLVSQPSAVNPKVRLRLKRSVVV